MPDKCVKAISGVYENNSAAVQVGNEFSSRFRIKAGTKQGCVLFSIIWIILMDFVSRNTRGNGRPWNEIGEEKLSWT